MRHITTTFLRGLGAVLPIALTIWLVVWLASRTEELLRGVFLVLLPEAYYVPGLGLALGVVLIYTVGVLVQLFVVNRLWQGLVRIFEGIPLVKTVYSALSDFFEFFSRRPGDASVAVSLDLFGDGTRLIGFVTGPAPAALIEGEPDEPMLAVYLPLSYQIGGYTLLVPESRVRRLDVRVEDAMRLVLTAGIGRLRSTAARAPRRSPGQ
jgi:uncharacterized membrane protein